MSQQGRVFVLGSFVVDLMCRTPHLPAHGETVFGGPFKLGPGGKGSNQAVAAARAGAQVSFLTKLGEDEFGDLAKRTFAQEGLDTRYTVTSKTHETGAALIMVEDGSAENMITVSVGACNTITDSEVQAAEQAIAAADIFITQLETNLSATFLGLDMARRHGVRTILNTAPIQKIELSRLSGIDFITPNETEASSLTGIKVTDTASAEKAADALLAAGVGCVLVTLGSKGVFIKGQGLRTHVPAFDIGTPVDTTGAGDAFNGGFAAALAQGLDIVEAARFGCAVAGLSVTRIGTAPAMPQRAEIEALLGGSWQREVA